MPLFLVLQPWNSCFNKIMLQNLIPVWKYWHPLEEDIADKTNDETVAYHHRFILCSALFVVATIFLNHMGLFKSYCCHNSLTEQSSFCQNEQAQPKSFYLRHLREIKVPEHVKKVWLNENAVMADVQLTVMGRILAAKRLMTVADGVTRQGMVSNEGRSMKNSRKNFWWIKTPQESLRKKYQLKIWKALIRTCCRYSELDHGEYVCMQQEEREVWGWKSTRPFYIQG